MIHRPYDRALVIIEGAVKKTGGSLNLAKGQLALTNQKETNKDGSKVITSLMGFPKDSKSLTLRTGIDAKTPNRTYSNKAQSTEVFSINEVVDLTVSAPKNKELVNDEVILGYNGIDDTTAFDLKTGDLYKAISVELTGDVISYLGGGKATERITQHFEVPNCNTLDSCINCDNCADIDCQAWTLNVIESLKRHQLTGGRELKDLIDITPVFKCDTAVTATTIDYDWSCLEVCDTGDASALAVVQAQYPDLVIERTERNGATSKYKTLAPQSAGLPTAFTKTIASLLKGCETCPAGYTATPEGIIYAISLEDDGTDQTAIVQAIPGAVAGSAKKSDGQDAGLGFYTVVLDNALTDVEFTAFVTANPTATVENIGAVQAICENATVTTTAWTNCGTCQVIAQKYVLDLPDTTCGTNRLAELQAAFPDSNVVLDPLGVTGGCQTRYQATVISNIVCDECSDIFKDYYVTEAPEQFDGRIWKFDTVANAGSLPTGNCKCGIRFKAKPFIISPSECYRDDIDFSEDSVRIRVSGGYPTEIREGIGRTHKDIFHMEYITRYAPRTHVGGRLQNFEENDRLHFSGVSGGEEPLKRLLRGTQSSIDQNAQYVDYALTIRPVNYAQSMSLQHSSTTTYHFYVEVGKHTSVETLLNTIATSAGINSVQAFGA